GQGFIVADEGAHFARGRIDGDERRLWTEFERERNGCRVGRVSALRRLEHAHTQCSAVADEVRGRKVCRIVALLTRQRDAPHDGAHLHVDGAGGVVTRDYAANVDAVTNR